MAIQSQAIGAGVAPLAANNLVGSHESGKTATGTNLATAYPISTAFIEFTTVAASTAAALPPATVCSPGDSIVVCNNGGANSLTVYTQSGETVDAAATSFAVAANKVAIFFKTSASHWAAIVKP